MGVVPNTLCIMKWPSAYGDKREKLLLNSDIHVRFARNRVLITNILSLIRSGFALGMSGRDYLKLIAMGRVTLNVCSTTLWTGV